MVPSGTAIRQRCTTEWAALLLGLFHADTGLRVTLVVAPLLTRDLAHVQAVHPSGTAGAGRGKPLSLHSTPA